MLHWAAGSAINAPGETPTFRTDFYLSGTTFFHVGIGRRDAANHAGEGDHGHRGRNRIRLSGPHDFVSADALRRVFPAGVEHFASRRSRGIASHGRGIAAPALAICGQRGPRLRILRDWEIWAAQLMESHLSYPVLCYFRSQHDNQSWLAAFTAVLDVSALLIAYGEGTAKWQSQLTFAIARHAVVDLAEVLRVPPSRPAQDRLPPKEVAAGPQPSGGMPRLQQVRRIGRQEADRIARNVRTLFERTFFALADAASLLGRWTPFRGKLEAVSVGENFFGAGGLRRFEQRIQPFLKHVDRRSAGVCAGVFELLATSEKSPAGRRRHENPTWRKNPINLRRPIPEKRDQDRRRGRSGVPSENRRLDGRPTFSARGVPPSCAAFPAFSFLFGASETWIST